jgi:hypothetical protein
VALCCKVPAFQSLFYLKQIDAVPSHKVVLLREDQCSQQGAGLHPPKDSCTSCVKVNQQNWCSTTKPVLANSVGFQLNVPNILFQYRPGAAGGAAMIRKLCTVVLEYVPEELIVSQEILRKVLCDLLRQTIPESDDNLRTPMSTPPLNGTYHFSAHRFPHQFEHIPCARDLSRMIQSDNRTNLVHTHADQGCLLDVFLTMFSPYVRSGKLVSSGLRLLDRGFLVKDLSRQTRTGSFNIATANAAGHSGN